MKTRPVRVKMPFLRFPKLTAHSRMGKALITLLPPFSNGERWRAWLGTLSEEERERKRKSMLRLERLGRK